MPSIHTESVRAQLDSVKKTFSSLLSEKKVSPQIESLFKMMLMLFELVLSIFMEKTTKKNSKNSGIPSSQTEKDDTAVRSTGAHKKGKKQCHYTSPNTRTNTTVETLPVDVLRRLNERDRLY